MREHLTQQDSDSLFVKRLNVWLIVVTAVTTILYALFYFWRMLEGPAAEGQNISSILPTNPRAMILLCLAATTTLLLFLPEIGKVLAAMSLGGVFYFFAYWWRMTAGIKASLGVSQIPGADGLGNTLLDASAFDVVIGVIAVILLVWDVGAIFKNFALHFRRDASSKLSRPMVAHK